MRSPCRRYAGVVERVVLQARPEEAVGAAPQAYAAVALGAPELAVVAQQVAEDGKVIAIDFRVAAGGDLEVAHALDDVGLDHGAIEVGIGTSGVAGSGLRGCCPCRGQR